MAIPHATTSAAISDQVEKRRNVLMERDDYMRGRLATRLVFCVFMTILLVEVMVMLFTVRSFEQEKLQELVEQTQAAVAPLFYNIQNSSGAGNLLENNTAMRLLATSRVRGFAIYDPKGSLFARDIYGETPSLTPDMNNRNPREIYTWRTPDKARYEVVLGPVQTQTLYTLVLRIDTTHLPILMRGFVLQTLIVVLLLTAFVTTVLMILLGKWLINPIMLLRANLIRAARDPQHPERYQTIYQHRDELGGAVHSANQLINQNAHNLSQISQKAKDKIYKLAFYDNLTELPNRAHFLQKIDECIEAAQKNKRAPLAVFVMDLDNFSDVNDTLGYEAGDMLLKYMGQQLTEALPDASLIARLGEDEFAIMWPLSEAADLSRYSTDDLMPVAQRIFDAFKKPFDIQSTELRIQVSIGAALYPRDTDKAIDLLKKAETALDQAKDEQRGTFCLFTPLFEHTVQNRIQMVRDLREAVEKDQFQLYYQPQFDAKTLKLIGAEALLRWERFDIEARRKMFVRPDHFIPVAEQSGVIVPIGRWVLREAARFAQECAAEGYPDFRVAVNISGVQMQQDDLVALTRDVLASTGLPAHKLELEVTESGVMGDMADNIRLLNQLKDLGIELAIDDFGTGYSSLAYLKKFPVHRLKIDRSFIMNLTEDEDDEAIAKTIIQLGHALNLKVIAEGVEAQGHVDKLLSLGCDEFQGYLFSKPLPAHEFKAFIKKHQAPLEPQA